MSQISDTITLPAHWGVYLVNGDASALDDGEPEAIDAYIASKLPTHARIVDMIEGSDRFTWSFDLYGGEARGGDVADFTYLVPAMVATPCQQQQACAAPADSDRLAELRGTADAFHRTDAAWQAALEAQFGRKARRARYSEAGRGERDSELRAIYVARYRAYSAWCAARNMPAIPDPVASAVTVMVATPVQQQQAQATTFERAVQPRQPEPDETHTPGPFGRHGVMVRDTTETVGGMFCIRPVGVTKSVTGRAIPFHGDVLAYAYRRPDADLFAASPALLSALRAVLPYAERRLEQLQDEKDEMPDHIWSAINGDEGLANAVAALEAARAAVASAEGRAVA